MIAVVQRVSRAEVRVEDTGYDASIEHGVVILLGVEQDDTTESADWLASKIARLRIFSDDDDKFNLSLLDVNGAALVVSQFTLAGDCRKGTRPSFDKAAPAAIAQPMYEYFVSRLRDGEGVRTETGVFQAKMQVELVNDGPVTIIVRHPK